LIKGVHVTNLIKNRKKILIKNGIHIMNKKNNTNSIMASYYLFQKLPLVYIMLLCFLHNDT